MTVGELKDLLDDYDDEFEVRLAHQPNYPLQSTIAGVAMVPLNEDGMADDEPHVVYIAEGSQIGYADGRIWQGM